MTVDEALSVLGLESDAAPDDIEVAWRELAQMLHPDRYGSNAKLRRRAERQMSRINEARDVLRRERGGRCGAAAGTARRGTATPPAARPSSVPTPPSARASRS